MNGADEEVREIVRLAVSGAAGAADDEPVVVQMELPALADLSGDRRAV